MTHNALVGIKSQDHLRSLIGATIDCLDHGFVRLVNFMGSDIDVSRAARASFDAAWRAGQDEDSDKKLINYLWKNSHSTPFESVEFQFEVKAPIFVFRQWHLHRMWSYNELSARYKKLPEEFYLPKPEQIGVQSKDSKQARVICEGEMAIGRQQEIDGAKALMEMAFRGYSELLASGWPRELARSVLPVATYSHMFAKVNLLNLLKFFSLHSDANAQYEIRVYSDAMKELIRPIVPVCLQAFETHKENTGE